jgi:DNA-binding LytR/AlgR family response regulator
MSRAQANAVYPAGPRVSLTLRPDEAAAIGRARVEFAEGASSLAGIRAGIALSWTRCRDRFAVDPRLSIAPPAGDAGARCLDRDVMLIEIGALAAAVESALGTGVVTVVDAEGELVGAWGEVRSASDARLMPWYAWSERASGTNGMGTALQSQALTSVRGPEHWCDGFQDLDCLGVSILDPVTGRAAAAVNVTTATGAMPEAAPSLLCSLSSSLRARMERLAAERGAEVAEAFRVAAGRRRGPVLALDAGARLVDADEAAVRLLGIGGTTPEQDLRRRRLEMPDLNAAVDRASTLAHSTPGWTGFAQLRLPRRQHDIEATFTAVMSGGHPVGFVVTFGKAEGVSLAVRDDGGRDAAATVAAHGKGRTLLLRPSEIALAHAEGNTVWLITDQGRVRAVERGLTRLETTLQARGFMRVHRRYLVNLSRVREAGRGRRGELLLFADLPGVPPVPVPRSRATAVRARLGL